jgi:hypothetical protein
MALIPKMVRNTLVATSGDTSDVCCPPLGMFHDASARMIPLFLGTKKLLLLLIFFLAKDGTWGEEGTKDLVTFAAEHVNVVALTNNASSIMIPTRTFLPKASVVVFMMMTMIMDQ